MATKMNLSRVKIYKWHYERKKKEVEQLKNVPANFKEKWRNSVIYFLNYKLVLGLMLSLDNYQLYNIKNLHAKSRKNW